MTAKPACRACETQAQLCDAIRNNHDLPSDRQLGAEMCADAIRQSCTHASPPSSEAGKWVPVAKLEEMREYWNGGQNQGAMSDALYFLDAELEKLLKPAAPEEK